MNANLQKYLFLLLLLSTLSGCHMVHYVPKDKLLLREEVKLKGNKSISLYSAIKTKPNRRVIWPKFYLGLYNTGTTLEHDSSAIKKWFIQKPGREQFFNNTVNWLTKEIGEPPVIVDRRSIQKDSLNIINAYAANGFFDTKADYKIDTISNYFERRRGKITFDIQEGKAFRIRSIWIKAPFEELQGHFINSKNKSYLQVGERFKYSNLDLERSRFANLLRTQGFFTFSPNSIQFKVDTFLNPNTHPLPEGANRVLSLSDTSAKNAKWLDVIMVMTESPVRYTISEVEVDLGRVDGAGSKIADIQRPITIRGPNMTEEDREAYQITERKLSKSHRLTFKVSPELIRLVNYNFIAERIYFHEGGQYDRRHAINTQQRLQDLPMFQYVLLNYEVDEERKRIKVIIQANFAPKFEFKTGLEAYTNDLSTSFTLPIFGASISLRNKNTFRRSELMELSLGGNIGLYPVNENKNKPFGQLQGKGNINFPRFILPFPKTWIPEKYREFSVLRPVTITGLTFLSELRDEYSRFSLNGNFNYRWFNQPQSQREQTQINLLSFEYIDYNNLDSAFQQEVNTLPPAIKRTYQSRFNTWMSGSYTVSDYLSTPRKPTYFSKINAEGGGVIPRLLEELSSSDATKKDHRLIIREGDSVGLSIGQYFKLWFEGKTQIPIKNGKFQLVLRGVIGGSRPLPFGNKTELVPFERRFFSGGPSSMRGWQSRTLGPGTFPIKELQTDTTAEDVSSLFALGGEYLFEFNAELRFHVWSYLDMAIFTDVGNVWINPKTNQDTDPNNFERAFLKKENLYPGWDAGIGFRLDFDFLILRIDLAQQLFDPARVVKDNPAKGWVLQEFPKGIGGNTFQVHVGIGYPF